MNNRCDSNKGHLIVPYHVTGAQEMFLWLQLILMLHGKPSHKVFKLGLCIDRAVNVARTYCISYISESWRELHIVCISVPCFAPFG